MCNIEFYEGERKQITAVIRSKSPNETIVVTKAEYELKRKYSDSALVSDKCEIDKNELSVLLEAIEKGSYELKITAEVGREIIIEKVNIEVR